MSISKREKMLLAATLSIVVGLGYYALGYQPLKEAVENKKIDKIKIDEKYEKALADIESLEGRKLDVKELTGKALNKSQRFYPTIMQEKLILELDALITAAEMKVTSLVWGDKQVTALEKFVQEKSVEVSSLEEIVKNYKGEEATDTSEAKNKDDKSSVKGVVTSENITATVNVESGYENIKKFLLSLEEYERKVNVTNISLTPLNEGTLTGTIVLEFYGVPKMDNSDDLYYNWVYNNNAVYGKDEIFSKGDASGAYSDGVSDATTNSFDIIGILKAVNSELPPFMIGKAGDNTFKSYLYGNSTKIEDVEVEFTEEDNKYYYSYRIGSNKYPKSGKGVEFTPKGSSLQVKLTSEVRVGSDDTSGINLNVINNTKKEVNVIISGDDSSNPRIPKPTAEGGTVNWISE